MSNTPEPTPTDLLTKLHKAALALIVVASIGLLLDLGGIAANFMAGNQPQISAEERATFQGYSLQTLVHAAFALPVLAGGLCMRRHKAYWLAMLGCCFALLPLCGPLYVIAIPYGFWGISLLRKPEVRQVFPGASTVG